MFFHVAYLTERERERERERKKERKKERAIERERSRCGNFTQREFF